MKINVTHVIDESRIGPLHVLIIAIGFLIMIMDGYDLVAMGATIPTVSGEWGRDPADFAWALSAALIGVLFGSSAAGAMGDWIGRRWTIVIMLVICGASMCATPLVDSMNELIAFRFVTGMGVGGCIPVTLAYTLEFMPRGVRNGLTAFMYSGAAMGTTVAGFVGPTLIDLGGWPYVFYFGGLIPLILAVLVAAAMPESLRFLVNRGCAPETAGSLLGRVDRTFAHKPEYEYTLGEVTREGSPVRELFGGRQTAVTLIVWLAFLGNQSLVFLLGLWMPDVVHAGRDTHRHRPVRAGALRARGSGRRHAVRRHRRPDSAGAGAARDLLARGGLRFRAGFFRRLHHAAGHGGRVHRVQRARFIPAAGHDDHGPVSDPGALHGNRVGVGGRAVRLDRQSTDRRGVARAGLRFPDHFRDRRDSGLAVRGERVRDRPARTGAGRRLDLLMGALRNLIAGTRQRVTSLWYPADRLSPVWRATGVDGD